MSSANRFNLAKGDRFNLSKCGDKNFFFSLEWDEPAKRLGVSYDLDASVFACAYNKNHNPKIVSDGHFVFYGQAAKPGDPFASPDNAILHSGDQTTGERDGEQIRIHLDRLDPKVEIMSVVVTIHKAIQRKQNFGEVTNARIRAFNMDSDGDPTDELFTFNLTGDHSKFTALHIGYIYLDDHDEWQWMANGTGFERTELNEFVQIYCENLDA